MEKRTDHGWVILDERGRAWDEHLYPTQEAAKETAAKVNSAYSVAAAKRVTSLRKQTSTTSKIETQLVIERG